MSPTAAITEPEVIDAQIYCVFEAVGRARRQRVADLLARGRRQPLADIRNVAMVLACELVPAATNGTVAFACGARDRSTVAFARRRVTALCETEPRYAEQVAQLRALCRRALSELQAPSPA